MERRVKILDVVAMSVDVPQHGLVLGQVGTVVEELAPGVFEVEFCDNDGRTYATAALNEDHLIILHYDPVEAV